MKKILGTIIISLFIFKPLSLNASSLNGLDGIKEFKLVVDSSKIEGKDIKCNITGEKVEDSVKYILSPTQIKLSENSRSIIFLDIQVMHDEVGCFGRFGIDVYEWKFIENSANRKVLSAASLWEYGVSFKDSTNNFSNAFINGVERSIKKFVVDWTEKNK